MSGAFTLKPMLEKSPQYWQFGDLDYWNQLFDPPSPTLFKRKSSEPPISKSHGGKIKRSKSIRKSKPGLPQ